MQKILRCITFITTMLVMLFSLAVTSFAFGAESDGKLEEPYAILENRLKAEVEKIADGTRTSTEIEIDYSDLGITYADVGEHMADILNVLYRDCSYEFFWWGEKGSSHATGTTLSQKFTVAPNYRGENEYTVDSAKISTAKKALSNADAIVEKYKSYSDREKLRAYFDEIRSLCEYDYDAYNASMSGETPLTIGSDPWNLIYVFDGDPDTKVICSGFSRAFEYLCDKSTFTGDVNCYCTSGIMGSGSHMWNTVTFGGKNYMLDATVGHFMLSAVSGSVSEGYTYENGKIYTYDALTNSAFDSDALEITKLDWSFSNGTLTLSYDGELGFRFEKSPFAGLGVKKLVLNGTTTAIADYAFFEFTDIEEVVLPNSVEKIGDYAFKGCTNLKKITMPDSMTSIGINAFCGCTNLQEITIPNGIKSIGGYTFYGCENLANITMPATLTSIGEYAFCNCKALSAATIPNSVASIGEYAFCGCTSLTSATIPSGVKVIPKRAFSGCTELTNCNIPSGVTVFGEYAFYNCSKMKAAINNTITEIGTYAFYNCSSLSGSVTFASGITNIPEYAFFRSGITGLTLPDNLTTIGKYAFYMCSNIKSLKAPLLGISLGYYFGAEDTGSNGGYIPTALETVIITKGTAVPEKYFQVCKTLKSVSLPEGITRIGTYAFYNCTQLSNVTLPDSVEYFEERAFSSCTALTEISIPSCVKSIGTYGIGFCSALETIIFRGSAPEIASDAFQSVKATVYYPSGNSSWTSSVMQNYGGTLSWNKLSLSAPVLTEAFNSATGVRVSWKAVDGAEKYRLLRKSTSETSWTNVGETTECSLIDKTAKSGSRYTYTVECINSSGTAVSLRDETGRTCTYIGLAKITSVSVAEGGIKIVWAKPTGAKNFRVMRKVDGETSWKVLTDVLGDSYVDITAKTGVKYRYTIRAITLAGNMYINSYNSTGWSGIMLGTPVLTEAFNSATGVRVSWKAVDGAEKYRLLRKSTSETSWTNVGETTECSLIDKTAKSGSRYTYTVECINSSGTAVSLRDETGRTCTYIGLAKITSVSVAEGGIKIVWAKPTGAKNFRVMRKVDGETSWKVLTDVLGDSYVDTTAKPGVKYRYTIRAITLAGDMYINSYNSTGWSGIMLGTPVLTEAFNSATGVRVSWKAVDGAEKYRLLRKSTSETSWTNVGETTECSLIDKTAKSASRYTYTVECINSSGTAVSLRDETGRTCTYIGLAKITSLSSVENGIKIVWAKPAGAKNFRVMRKVDGESKWEILTDVLGDSYVDTTAKPGVKYRYTIRAITLAGDMYINSYNSTGWSFIIE